MNVHLQHNWASEAWDITFYDRARGGQLTALRRDGDHWVWDLRDPHADFPPSLTLPGAALEALLQEAGKVLPATHATERHLDDAVKVRDRLLALVEAGWEQ